MIHDYQLIMISILYLLYSQIAKLSGGSSFNYEKSRMFAFWAWLLAWLQGAPVRCRCKVLVLACCLRFWAWVLVPLLRVLWSLVGGAATAGCRCRVLPSWCCCQSAVRTLGLQGCWCRSKVPLQGAAVRVLFALWSLVAGAAAWVLLQGAAVRMLFALWSFVGARVSLWSLVAGATAGCCLRTGAWLLMPLAACRWKVLLSECCVRFGAWLLVPLQGARAGCRLQGAAARCCSEWKCRCRVLLQGAAVGVRVLFALWSLQGAPVRVLCALWGLVAGPAAGCRCRVLVSECCARWKKNM